MKTIGPLQGSDIQAIICNSPAPPTIAQLAPQVAASGLQLGDVVLKAVVHSPSGDQVVDATGLDKAAFEKSLIGASTFTLTVASQAGVSGQSSYFPNSGSELRKLPWEPVHSTLNMCKLVYLFCLCQHCSGLVLRFQGRLPETSGLLHKY